MGEVHMLEWKRCKTNNYYHTEVITGGSLICWIVLLSALVNFHLVILGKVRNSNYVMPIHTA